jgi:hypothetical protein
MSKADKQGWKYVPQNLLGPGIVLILQGDRSSARSKYTVYTGVYSGLPQGYTLPALLMYVCM